VSLPASASRAGAGKSSNLERRWTCLPEIKDADIEQVDAVDRPATGRKWLILKSEEEDEEMVNLEELQKAAMSVIEAVKKEASEGEVELGEEAVEALNTLAKLLNADVQFKAKAKKKPEEEYGYGYPEPEDDKKKPKKKAEDEDQLLKALEAQMQVLNEIKDALQKQQVAKSAPASKQPEDPARVEKSTARKWGEGLFADVIFGN